MCWNLADHSLQEVNPSLSDDASVKQTVAVGCSLVRSALGQRPHFPRQLSSGLTSPFHRRRDSSVNVELSQINGIAQCITRHDNTLYSCCLNAVP